MNPWLLAVSALTYLGQHAFGPARRQRLGAFAADRFGELYAQWVAREENGLPGVAELLERLGQIEVGCEECGVRRFPLAGES